MARAVAQRQAPLVDIGVGLLAVPDQGGFEQRGLQDAAAPGLLAPLQQGQRADHGPHARALVAHRRARAHGRVIRAAVDAGQAAEGLHEGFVARLHGHRAGAAEGRDLAVDQARVARAQAGPVNAQLGRHAGAQVVDEDVGLAHQALERGQPVGAFQVQRHRLFAAIEDVEVERVAMPERRSHGARVVAAFDALDLDHFGAQVGEDRAGKRPGQHLAQLQHAHTSQHAHRGRITHACLLWMKGSLGSHV